MIINSYSKRSIASQTGNFSYQLEIMCNTAGRVEFGFSGEQRLFSFTGLSGKLVDNEGDFIYGYSSPERFTVSGNVSQSSHDYFINGLPINIGGTKNTGNAEWFYVNPINCAPDIDLRIVGERPSLIFSSIYYSGLNATGTGLLTNGSSSRIKIFSGVSYDNNFSIFFNSGHIQGSSIFTGIKKNIGISTIDDNVLVDYRLITNFGDTYIALNNITDFQLIQNLYLQFNSSILSTGTNNGSIFWENLVGAQPYSDFSLPVSFSFVWSSGLSSGNFSGYWQFLSGLQDGSQLLSVNYYSGITGFSGEFDSVGAGARYLRMQKLLSGTDIGLLTVNGYNTGLSLYVTGGL